MYNMYYPNYSNYPYAYYPEYYRYPQPAVDPYWQMREKYPEVDTSLLKDSAHNYHQLIAEAGLLLEKLEEDKFASEIMSAAQRGDKAEVNRLIQSVDGVTDSVEVHYTPTGIRFDMATKDFVEGKSDCCQLNIHLRWGF